MKGVEGEGAWRQLQCIREVGQEGFQGRLLQQGRAGQELEQTEEARSQQNSGAAGPGQPGC